MSIGIPDVDEFQSTLSINLDFLRLYDKTTHPSYHTYPTFWDETLECDMLDFICNILAGDDTSRPFAAALDKHHPLTLILARAGGATPADRALARTLFSAVQTTDDLLPFVIQHAPGALQRLLRKLGALDTDALGRALRAYTPAADLADEARTPGARANWTELCASLPPGSTHDTYALLFRVLAQAAYCRVDAAPDCASRLRFVFLVADVLAHTRFFALAGQTDPARAARRYLERVGAFARALAFVPAVRRRYFAPGARIPLHWAEDAQPGRVLVGAAGAVVHAEVQLAQWFHAQRPLEEALEWPHAGARGYSWGEAGCDWVYRGGDWAEGAGRVRWIGGSRRACVCCEAWLAARARAWRTARGWGRAFADWAYPWAAEESAAEWDDAHAFGALVAERVDDIHHGWEEEKRLGGVGDGELSTRLCASKPQEDMDGWTIMSLVAASA